MLSDHSNKYLVNIVLINANSAETIAAGFISEKK